ncbi:MAG: hypothetical protein OEL84_02545 [Nitrosopumilus sp.]|nr:hypothetical protein [Nitrosopumilus sp.]
MDTIVVRVNNSKNLPDIKMIIQKLKDDGRLKELSDKVYLTVDELKNYIEIMQIFL